MKSCRSLTKIAGSASASGSISQRYGSADPDPYQNFMGPQHWVGPKIKYGARSPKFIWTPCAQLYPFPPPPFGLIYEGAIGQPRLTTSL